MTTRSWRATRVAWWALAMASLTPAWVCGQVPHGDASLIEGNEPHAPMGVMVGEVTSDSAVLQVRLCRSDHLINGDVAGMAGKVEFLIQPLTVASAVPVSRKNSQRLVARTEASHDFIARVLCEHLRPGTSYLCRTRLSVAAGRWKDGPSALFRTLPGAGASTVVKFAVVTGMNYAKFHGSSAIDRKRHLEQNNIALPPPYQGKDKALGYPALETLRNERPHFLVGTGDNVYYDTPVKGRAKTIAEMRRKWHEQFIQPRYQRLFELVPTYWEVDDHDYRMDDCDNSGDEAPTPELAQRVMWEQLPYGAYEAKERRTYRTHRVTRELQIWLLEGRIYRSPNSMPDGPNKSIWGKEQRAWLQRTLEESDATFKLVISPTPLIGPDDLRKKDNHCDIGGFRHERDSFFKWLDESGVGRRHVYFVCGDRHWQYHSIDPSGFEEFSCGALVDANARLGRQPGDPKSTDPEGRIRQPYTQSKPSGGFLLVSVVPSMAGKPARLVFEFCDERGTRLHVHEKSE